MEVLPTGASFARLDIDGWNRWFPDHQIFGNKTTAFRLYLSGTAMDNGHDQSIDQTMLALVDRHLDPLYRFAFRLTGSAADAEDLVQETFLIAQQKLHQLREPERARAWLFQILRRCRYQWYAQAMPVANVPVDEMADDLATPIGSIDDLDRDHVVAVLSELPDEYREPLLLFYFEGFLYREIAEILGCPLGTVMSRLARGKALLRDRLATLGVP